MSLSLFESVDGFARQFRFFAAHACGGEFDRFVDFDVARAAAEIAGEGFFDLFARRVGVGGEQFFCDEQEAGRAVAALRRARVGEGLLQRVQAVLVRHPLDRLDAAALGLDAEGRRVETVEGMADEDGLHPLQVTFADTGAAQCGYCTPGFLLVAKELLAQNTNPSRDEIKDALAGNLCRCTGYIKIYEAVELAAARMRGEEMELPRESVYGLD